MPGQRAFLTSILAAAVLTACSHAPTGPSASVTDAPTGAPLAFTDAMLREATATHVLSGPLSPAARRAIAEAERLVGGASRPWVAGVGPQLALPPVDPNVTPAEAAVILWNVTLVLYRNNFFADATGNPRADRAMAILHPVDYAQEGIAANDSDQGIAGFEATIEWYEQRNAEGLVPADVAQFLYDYANIGINKLGGSRTTRTLCLSSDERSCVTMRLSSVRWELLHLRTRLSYDVSYAFLDGDPAHIEARYRLVTGAPNCVLNTNFVTTGDNLLTVVARLSPAIVANPLNGGSTTFPCVPTGLIRGFQWDGFTVRDESGTVTGSCGKVLGSPCWVAGASTD
jgi:hypothetical protein